jgi:hypothetical protein
VTLGLTVWSGRNRLFALQAHSPGARQYNVFLDGVVVASLVQARDDRPVWVADLLLDLPIAVRPPPFKRLEHTFSSFELARAWLGHPEIEEAPHQSVVDSARVAPEPNAPCPVCLMIQILVKPAKIRIGAIRFELRWSDIGHAHLSGRYPFRGGEIDIQARHIYAWKQDPDGLWEVSSYVGFQGRARYGVLGFTPSHCFTQKPAGQLSRSKDEGARVARPQGPKGLS